MNVPRRRAPATGVGLIAGLLLTSGALAVACGKGKPTEDPTGAGGAGGGSGRVLVTVSGSVAPHPLNAKLGASDDFSMLQVAIIDPLTTLADPTTPPLASMPLDTSAANCDAALGCAFSLIGVDITKQTLGLVGSVDDKRAAGAQLWVKTGTGLATKEQLAEVRAMPAPITNRRGFAVSRKLQAKLAAFVSKTLGITLTADELEARGYLIGHVVGKVSEGNPDPIPVAGATVTSSSTTTEPFELLYPNADFTAKGTATAADGLFIVVPKTAASFVTSWNVVPPQDDPRVWATSLGGTTPGGAFVMILPANETP
jgi:hypothetical protein